VTDPTFTRHTGEQTLAILPELAGVYEDARCQDPDRGDPLFSRPQFIGRTKDQARRVGFELVTVHAGDMLAGFSFGFPLGPGAWWADADKPPKPLLAAAKFAVIELDVRLAYQGRGLAKALLSALLDERVETYATLAATPGSQAQTMYERWGWTKIGTIGGEGPLMDALVLPLSEED
jgi:GNAT superfamily N-acetyltransferase